jgi:hypothetical protein
VLSFEFSPEMGRHVPEADDPSVRELTYKSQQTLIIIPAGFGRGKS